MLSDYNVFVYRWISSIYDVCLSQYRYFLSVPVLIGPWHMYIHVPTAQAADSSFIINLGLWQFGSLNVVIYIY